MNKSNCWLCRMLSALYNLFCKRTPLICYIGDPPDTERPIGQPPYPPTPKRICFFTQENPEIKYIEDIVSFEIIEPEALEVLRSGREVKITFIELPSKKNE